MKKKKLFIFDVDGTLADAYKAIEKSLNFTLRELGYPPVATYHDVKRKVGRGEKFFMHAFFTERDFKRALEIYQIHHKKSIMRYAELKPYSRWLLYTLKRKRKIVAIASNRPHYYTNLILKKLKILKYLDYIVCADDVKRLKPHPKILNTVLKRFKIKKKEVVYIGDMDVDLETAAQAGIDAVFVKGGSSYLKDVKKYKNKKIVSSLKEISDLFE